VKETAAHTLLKFSNWLDKSIDFTWAAAALVASTPGDIALQCTSSELNDCDDDASSDASQTDTDNDELQQQQQQQQQCDTQTHYCHSRAVREKYGQCRVARLLRQEALLLQQARNSGATTFSSSSRSSSGSSGSSKHKRADDSGAAALPARNLAADMAAETNSSNSSSSNSSSSNSSSSNSSSSNSSSGTSSSTSSNSAKASTASVSNSTHDGSCSSGSCSKLLAQCSSLSRARAFTAGWMQQFYSNCMPDSSSALNFSEGLQIVWPTVACVRESLGGFVGGVAVKWQPHGTDNKV
jgi:hypothetical protein